MNVRLSTKKNLYRSSTFKFQMVDKTTKFTQMVIYNKTSQFSVLKVDARKLFVLHSLLTPMLKPWLYTSSTNKSSSFLCALISDNIPSFSCTKVIQDQFLRLFWLLTISCSAVLNLYWFLDYISLHFSKIFPFFIFSKIQQFLFTN